MKIASFTFKGKHYLITSSDWFWSRVRTYPLPVAGGLLCLAVIAWVWLA